MPVAEVMTMTPAEYEGWRWHLARYPSAEYILAALWLTVSRALGNKKAGPEDMGHWLEAPEARARRKETEARAQRLAQAGQVAEAYGRRKVKE